MNFEKWFSNIERVNGDNKLWSRKSWNTCKNQILKLLEQNKELESISHNGKKVYKIYGTVIEKIKNEI